jgi:hypothetical protein
MKREETNKMFIEYGKDLQIDWENIKTKIKADKKMEEDAA